MCTQIPQDDKRSMNKNKTNILVFTSSVKPEDGWSVVGCNIIKDLNECNTEIFCSEEKKQIKFGFNRLKSEMYEKYKLLVVFYDVINVLIKIKKKPDLIYCNVEHYAPLAMIIARIYKIPYTITAHGTYGVVLPKKFKIYKEAFKRANKVITVSQYTKKRMLEEHIRANYEVVCNGVDKNIFTSDSKVKKENIITFVGNLKPRKGLSFLLESMIAVNKTRPDIKLIVIGNIDLKCEKYLAVFDYIQSNNLNVEFLGKVSENELIFHYQKAKLNILPSQTEPFYFEGFGLIHIEANACGTLSIGTKNSGNEDAILDGNGYLIDYGDKKKLQSLILNIFSLSNYPKIDMHKISSWKEVSQRYFEIFKEVIND